MIGSPGFAVLVYYLAQEVPAAGYVDFVSALLVCLSYYSLY